MVQLQSPNASSASLPQDTNLRQFLQRQANVELDEVHTKTINEWIKLGHEYLRDVSSYRPDPCIGRNRHILLILTCVPSLYQFDEAILKDDSDAAYIKFLIASR